MYAPHPTTPPTPPHPRAPDIFVFVFLVFPISLGPNSFESLDPSTALSSPDDLFVYEQNMALGYLSTSEEVPQTLIQHDRKGSSTEYTFKHWRHILSNLLGSSYTISVIYANNVEMKSKVGVQFRDFSQSEIKSSFVILKEKNGHFNKMWVI